MACSPRQGLTQLFSAFIEFKTDNFQRWMTDSSLRQSMESQLKRSDQRAEAFWSLYWHKAWQMGSQNRAQQHLGRQHLMAYLQEPCYWTARKACRYLRDSQYRLSDCFQLALAHLDRVLTGFKPERGASLKGYAKLALPTLIRDILRQRKDAQLCTNWALLRRISRRQLVHALQEAGLTEASIDPYLLAWDCYRACHKPGQAKRASASEAIPSKADAPKTSRFKKLETHPWETTASLLID